MEGKRSSSASNSSSSSCEIVKKQKRQISIATFNKWQSLYSREHDSLVWLRCDKDQEDKSIVSTLLKMGRYRYTLIGVIEEVLLQHPCLASIFSSIIPVEYIPTLWTNSCILSSITPLCEHATNYKFSGENFC